MSQPDFYTMCATVFAPGGSFDEAAMRVYLQRQIDARLGVYLGSAGNGETHAMSPDELFRLYAVGVEECRARCRSTPICLRSIPPSRRSPRPGSRSRRASRHCTSTR